MLFEEDVGNDKSVYMASVSALTAAISTPSSSSPATSSDDDNTLDSLLGEVLVGLYTTEIEKQIGMDKYKSSKIQPKPIDKSSLSLQPSAPFCTSLKDRDVWGVTESVAQLRRCVYEMKGGESGKGGVAIGSCAFDKE
jgi:hypothetical protein